jgi:hypothetical protein
VNLEVYISKVLIIFYAAWYACCLYMEIVIQQQDVQATLNYLGGGLAGLQINHGSFSTFPPLTMISGKEFVGALVNGVWFDLFCDSSMSGWGCDK